MKKWLFFALLLSFASIVGQLYLSQRSYQLQVGETSSHSICHITENINCDSALLSPYSHLFGISITNFGAALNLSLFFILLAFLFINLGAYWKNTAFYISCTTAIASIIMGGISIIHSLYCPVCWALHFLSFATLAFVFLSFKQDLSPLVASSKLLRQKNIYVLGVVILGISLFLHMSFMTSFNIKNRKKDLSVLLTDWKQEKAIKITPASLLQRNSQESNIVLVEFVDFLCPACKQFQPALKLFLSHFKDVEFHFFVYPLDKTCNPFISVTRSGLSCELSKAVICANQQNKGWEMHDFIFQNQESFLKAQNHLQKTKTLFENMIDQLDIQKKDFELCMKDPNTLEKINQSAQAVETEYIHGTPSFFMNGKKIRYSSSKLLILRTIYEYIKK